MDALHEVAGLGPFFTVATDLREPGWRPLAELTEPQTLRERVATACAFLAERFRVRPDEIDERAVASMQFLGTAARLLSPTLATAVCHGVLPAGGSAHWRPSEGGRVEFALVGPAARGADPAAFDQLVLAGPVAEIERAARREFRLSAHVTRGNVASALAGAVTVLAGARPAAATAAVRFGHAVLGLDFLAGYGTWPRDGQFRRTNCCLFYRLPGAGKCGDCVLLGGRHN